MDPFPQNPLLRVHNWGVGNLVHMGLDRFFEVWLHCVHNKVGLLDNKLNFRCRVGDILHIVLDLPYNRLAFPVVVLCMLVMYLAPRLGYLFAILKY